MKRIAILSVILLLGLSLQAAVRLPKLISDGMVLQRDTKLKIRGWADPLETVRLTFNKKLYTAKAGASGQWEIFLPAQKAGGPYVMQINGITLNDIYVGDVWVCSGQSNMETYISRVLDLYADEVAVANNPQIHFIIEPHGYIPESPQEEITGGEWKAVTPENILPLSAVAYFFAQELYDKYKVPIGLIQAAVGGSAIESWLSKEALQPYPKYLHDIKRQIEQNQAERSERSEGRNAQGDGERFRPPVVQDEGAGKWHLPDVDVTGWKPMDLPGYWADKGLGAINGVFWFRKTITVPTEWASQEATLRLGNITNSDSAWINGTFVGNTTYQYPPRIYKVPAGVLKAGYNVITVRVENSAGRGGFVEDKPFKLIVGKENIDLAGKWKYRIGRLTAFPPMRAGSASVSMPTTRPAGMYNAMIAPLIQYPVKGALWYQGESNTGQAKEYASLFPALVKDWRNKWNNPDMPFLYVQLPNFMTPDAYPPQESGWAELREVQRKALSTLPNIGMAVTIDVGEWNDIHPLNKKDVGHRLALQARRIAYGEKIIVASGPLYKETVLRGDSLVISFTETGSGLADDEPLRGFAISADGKYFVWANARVEGDRVVVWSEFVKRPTVVRYAWGNNPVNANLRNKEGLPASPFSTISNDEIK
ncbi:MAG: beta galactosidase jelly roll domain-containing protein [Dysgonamonadaceae bacterium]|jgi:sialate O-acetylesterase|nr:beta galactosidase jelly roll domain-containing protein [Dysgonamonadaceae bacterium]